MDFAAHFNLRDVEPIADRIFRAKTHQGITVCLKTYTNVINFKRAVSATQILNYAAAPVPVLLDWATSDTKAAILQSWWDGHSGEAIFDQLNRLEQQRVLNEIGATHGLIQRILAPETIIQGTFWHRLGIESADQYSWRTYLAAIVTANITRIQAHPDSSHLSSILAAVQQFLTTLTEPETLAIIHGDFVLRNVMFRPNLASIAGIIDWDLTLIGDPVYDLAKITWTDLDPNNSEHREALFEGWQAATGWNIDPPLFTYYEAIQAIAALAWIIKQPRATAGLEHFRSLALTTLDRHRQHI